MDAYMLVGCDFHDELEDVWKYGEPEQNQASRRSMSRIMAMWMNASDEAGKRS